MLKTGCTAAYDLFLAVPAVTDETFEAVARAYSDVGVRVVLAPAVADIVFHRTVPGLRSLELLAGSAPRRRRHRAGTDEGPRRPHRAAHQAVARQRRHGRRRAAVSPTIPNQATDELLDGCAALSREHGVGLHTHLAESKVQVIESRRRQGKTIVARLAERGALGPGFVGGTRSGSTTTISACWPTPAPRSPTTPAATSAWARVSRRCARCSTAAAVGLGTDGSAAPTARTSSRPSASPRS